MKPFSLLVIFSFLFSCCHQDTGTITSNGEHGKVKDEPTPFIFNKVDTLLTGIPVPAIGKNIDMDTLPEPRYPPFESTTKDVLATNRIDTAQTILVVPVSADLRVFSPGKNGVPYPETIVVKSRKVKVRQPEPIQSLPLRRDENSSYDVQFLDIEQGITSSTVYETLEDNRGNIWFGTKGTGLTCYNGLYLRNYTVMEGLADNYVFQILQDSQGDLWLGTAQGITRFDGNYFYHYAIPEFETGFIPINDMLIDQRGIIWIGTRSQGLIRFDPDLQGQDSARLTYFNTEQGLINSHVYCLKEDSRGRLWVGSYNGVVRYDSAAEQGQMGSFVQYPSRYKDGGSFTGWGKGVMGWNIQSIAEDSEGGIWFGCQSRLIRLDFGDDQENITFFVNKDTFENNFISSILEDEESNLWILTFGGKLYSFDGKYFTQYVTSKIPSYQLTEDSGGNLWISTDGNGLIRFRKESFFHLDTKDGLIHNNVSSILEDKNGDLWFRTRGGGICRFTNGPEKMDAGVFTHFIPYNITFAYGDCLFEDSEGNLWVGGNSAASVCRFDENGFMVYPKQKGLPAGVTAIVEDGHNNLWFGTTTEGLSVLNAIESGSGQSERFTQFSIENGMSSTYAQPTLVDEQGKLWILSWQNGVSYYEPGSSNKLSGGTFTHLTTNEGLSNNNVLCMLEDNQGYLWFGTEGSGVSRFNGKDDQVSFSHFTSKEGLSNDIIRSMVQDRNNNIWISTNKGISLLVPKSTPPALSNASLKETYKCLTFAKEDGLKGLDFNSSVCLDSKGRIWWGSDEGVTMLDLNYFQLPSDPPGNVSLLNIEINQNFVDYRGLSDTAYSHIFPFGNELNQSFDSVVAFYNYPQNLKLPYDLNHLTFHFSAIDWASPGKLKYSFRIKNLDKDWSPAQSEPKADYRNLPNGTFTLQVRAMGAAQVWSAPFEFNFTILPPWYRTWLAYTLWGGLFLLCIYGLYNFLLNRQLAIAEARRLKELDLVKTRLYTNITHEFRTPLTIILGMSRQMKSDPRKWYNEGLRLIHRNGKQLLNLVNQMLDLSRLESGKMPLKEINGEVIGFLQYIIEFFHSYADSKDIRLHFMPDLDEFYMDFDPEKLQKVVTNLLSNAIKFTPSGGNVYLDLRLEESKEKSFQIQIRDDGIGIKPENLPFIFNRFYQGDVSYPQGRKGTGIGLALVKELVYAMEGEIEVNSTSGKGTRFTILLPVKHTAAKQSSENISEMSQYFRNNLISETGNNAIIPDTPNSDHPLLLLLEDNEDILIYLTSFLSANYQVITATDGQKGIERALEFIPDLIVSDVMMPEKDGYEVCATLKADERTSHIPIVLLTAKSDQASKVEGLGVGADAYLAKPFDHEELLVRIDRLIELRRQLQKRFQQSGALFQTLNSPTSTREEAFLQKVLEVIEKNMNNEHFGMPQLCKELHISRSHLFRKLKAITGKSATHLIRSMRLEKAKELLKNSHMNVTEVCFAVGFTNPGYFSMIFSEEFGMSPNTFQKGKRK